MKKNLSYQLSRKPRITQTIQLFNEHQTSKLMIKGVPAQNTFDKWHWEKTFRKKYSEKEKISKIPLKKLYTNLYINPSLTIILFHE